MTDEAQSAEHEVRKYWMVPEALVPVPPPAGEFVSDPREEPTTPDEFSRRDFLKLMGVAAVLAGAAACTRRPVEKIIPYLNKPEEVVPGDALWYASTSLDCPCQCGVLVKTREGRPIKLEGNPDHPVNRGGLCTRAQAAVWNLYDPDRLKTPVWRDRKAGTNSDVTWDTVDHRLREALQQINARRGKVRVWTGATGGPAQQQLLTEFLAAQGDAKHVVYESVNTDEIVRAQHECYGQALTPHYRFDRADVVVSFGADFLGTWISPVEFARDWARGRKLDAEEAHRMSRLIAFEPILTLTGTNADERYPVRASDMITVVLSLAHELAVVKGLGGGGEAATALAPYAIAKQSERLGIPAAVLQRVATELMMARGKALVIGGLLTGSLGVTLQIAINFLNSVLGADGSTVEWTHRMSRQTPGSSTDLRFLLEEMRAGSVDCLIMSGVNPLFSLPPALDFATALAKVPLVVHITDRLDETAALADAVLPVSHFLEGWGDAEPQTGVYSLVQPTIAPLYSTRTFAANLMAWMDGTHLDGRIVQPNAPHPSPDEYWYEYLRAIWRDRVYPTAATAVPFEVFWDGALRDGVVTAQRDDRSSSPRTFRAAALAHATNGVRPTTRELVCYPTIAIYDGRHANNSLLQELPDPVTKITWDNYLCISPRTAKQLGLEEEDVVEVRAANDDQRTTINAVALPIHIQPGTSDDVAGVPIGYGRTAAGRAGNGVGVNIHSLATVSAEGIAWAGIPVTIQKTGRRAKLAATQTHHRYEGRPIIQEATLAEYQKDPRSGHEEGHQLPPSMWEPHKYPGHRWAMAIDLNSCTGCSACVIGCMVENNIAVAGKKQVLKGREMQWIRLDRYYSGPEEKPDVVHQPMLCQHCEKAPCETVCPVLATIHNDEGLNVQVYNRCVGTRYCSNNCPYKVRRFNWFDYGNKQRDAYVWKEPLQLMLNPDVTVREKGVMEKCTFCIQRIRKGKEEAKAKGIPVADGDIKTACQQSCPTDAIVFGDINDPASRVARFAKQPRGYTVLRELNTLPQVTYLTKVRNKTA